MITPTSPAAKRGAPAHEAGEIDRDQRQHTENADRIELGRLKVAVEVHVSSYRSVRGRTLVAALLDETAFWRSETSANPAEEVVRALKPALATLAPASILIGASSPYSRQGLIWDQYRKHFGREGSHILVWQAPSRIMNPALDAELVADALAEDPEGAAAEWLAEFRRDIARFVDPAVIETAVVPGRHELPSPRIGRRDARYSKILPGMLPSSAGSSHCSSRRTSAVDCSRSASA